MPGPNTPTTASLPVPPPVLNLPWGRVQAGGDVLLTVQAIQFLQELWAALQGQGGVIDQQLFIGVNPGSALRSAIEDAVLLAQAPVVPQPVTTANLNASEQAQPPDPTAPASTAAYAMQGLAGAITPTNTGTLLIVISGTVISPSGVTAGLGIAHQLSYGTGAAPVNGASPTGTQVGTVQSYTNPAAVTAADVNIPFSVQALVTGLAPGTPYWIDLAAKSLGTASSMGLSNISLSAVEF